MEVEQLGEVHLLALPKPFKEVKMLFTSVLLAVGAADLHKVLRGDLRVTIDSE